MNKQERIKTLGFDDIWAMVLGIPIIGFFIPILFFNQNLSDGIGPYLPHFLVSTAYCVAYWVCVRFIFIHLRKRFPAHSETAKRIIYTIFGILVVYIIVNIFMDIIVHQWLGMGHEKEVTDLDYQVASLTIIALVSTLYESVFFYARWKQSILETEQLKREHVQSQLEGLKSQVNPHFLFNSLNTLVYIIPEDSEKAVEFVRKMSKVYRYILEIRDKKLISLEEELHFLQAYIFLLQVRFEENINIKIEIPEAYQKAQIVPLSLQILFENTIKHNIISSERPLNIEVFIQDGSTLVVRNNLQKKNQKMSSTKIGLQNIRTRFSFFSDKDILIEECGQYFTVSLPLINLPLKV